MLKEEYRRATKKYATESLELQKKLKAAENEIKSLKADREAFLKNSKYFQVDELARS